MSGILEEEVYVQQPEDFLVKVQEDKIYCLKKALYSLKQAPRAWNARIDGYLQQKDFTKCPYEHAIYMKRNHQGEFLIICLYVDDLLYTGSCVEMLAEFKEAMFNEFEMTDNGLMSYFLGIEVKQQQDEIFISQKKYMKEILEKFKMSNCVTVPDFLNLQLG